VTSRLGTRNQIIFFTVYHVVLDTERLKFVLAKTTEIFRKKLKLKLSLAYLPFKVKEFFLLS
jgi:hypothetical protein